MPPRRSLSSGGENPEFIMRDFVGGMHNFAAREAINDDEFWWCENAIPLAPGNLQPTPTNSAALQTIFTNGFPSYVMSFNSNGTPYLFLAFSNFLTAGNAYVVNLTTLAVTQIISGQLSTSGGTYATQYSNQGILIIDPNGYWDWGVTTPNTLTPWNNSISSVTITSQTSVAGGTQLKQSAALSGGSGGVVQSVYEVISAVVNAAGTGYVVGDALTLTDNNPTTPAQIIVSAIGAGGAISGITLATGGAYPGPNSTSLVATGPSGNTVSGGTGTGATFKTTIQATGFNVTSPGHGYTNGFADSDETATPTVITSWALVTSGVIGGTSIAVYAGRVWIGNGRTVYVTNINSYSSFGGAGTNFTINDSYLVANITCLYSANNYLYIFGNTSVDALSNVTISAGVTSFTRINIVQGIGTSQPTSVFGFSRTIMFYDASGIYILSGASAEKISEKITNVLKAIVNNSTLFNSNYIYGAFFTFNRELCAAFQFAFTDNVTQSGVQRNVIAVFFRKRWFLYSLSPAVSFPSGGASPLVAMASAFVTSPYVTLGSATGLFVISSNATSGVNSVLYQAFSPTAALSTWILKTKLWDGGGPFHEKQAINSAIAGTLSGLSTTGVSFTIDTEHGSSSPLSYPLNEASGTGYQLMPYQGNAGQAGGVQAAPDGNQYIGLTLTNSSANLTQLNILALRGKAERNMLE
jgi:hypothetical protein